MSKHVCDSEFPLYSSDARADEFYKLRVKELSPTQFTVGKTEIEVRALLDQDILAGKHTFDDFVFEVDEQGKLELTDDDLEIIDETLYLWNSDEMRGLHGFRGNR